MTRGICAYEYLWTDMQNWIAVGIATERNERREGLQWGKYIIYPISFFSCHVIAGCSTMIQMQRKSMPPHVLLVACHRSPGQDKQAGIPSLLDKLSQKVNKTSSKSTAQSPTQSFPKSPSASLFHTEDNFLHQAPEKRINTTNHQGDVTQNHLTPIRVATIN